MSRILYNRFRVQAFIGTRTRGSLIESILFDGIWLFNGKWAELVQTWEAFGWRLEGTPGYKTSQFSLIVNYWKHMVLLLTLQGNSVTIFFLASFGRASLSVPSYISQSPDFSSFGPKLRPLYCCDTNLCGDRVGRWGLNGSPQLLSQLRIMHFNSKIINQKSDIAQNEFLLVVFVVINA